MQYTTHYNLKKPELTDFSLITELGNDMDTIDDALHDLDTSKLDTDGNAAEATVGTVTASTASYPTPTAGEKLRVIVGKINRYLALLKSDKLGTDGDAANTKIGSSTASSASFPVPAANDTLKVMLGKIIKFCADIKAAYTSVSVSGKTITFTTANGTTKQITTQDTTYSNATTSAPGLLKKLDGTATKYLNGAGNWATPSNATTSAAGYMSAADKTKLNDVATGATVSGVIDIQAGVKESLASSTSTITTVASKTVSTAGTYLVMMTASTASSASTGYLRGVINTSAAWGAAPSNAAMNGTGACVSSFYVYTISSSTTFRALVQQSSGAAQDVRWNFAVIRLS